MAKKRLQKTVRQQLEQQQQRQQQALQIMATHTPQMKRETTIILLAQKLFACAVLGPPPRAFDFGSLWLYF